MNRLICNILVLLVLGTQVASASRSKHRIHTDMDEDEIASVLQEAPVHKGILTTVFWIGERAKPNSGWSDNIDSAWDSRWKENFGGLDSPILRKGFFPAKFRPKQNPFYVALPFNDITNPEHLESNPILQFFKKTARAKSVCKNRWIEIQYDGRCCYGQWQDVGPIYTDDYDYVFEGQEPRAHEQSMAGLDISPAVRDFLKIRTTCHTSWRFVDESEVPNGPWKAVVTRS